MATKELPHNENKDFNSRMKSSKRAKQRTEQQQ